jgi:hypothetical protein
VSTSFTVNPPILLRDTKRFWLYHDAIRGAQVLPGVLPATCTICYFLNNVFSSVNVYRLENVRMMDLTDWTICFNLLIKFTERKPFLWWVGPIRTIDMQPICRQNQKAPPTCFGGNFYTKFLINCWNVNTMSSVTAENHIEPISLLILHAHNPWCANPCKSSEAVMFVVNFGLRPN